MPPVLLACGLAWAALVERNDRSACAAPTCRVCAAVAVGVRSVRAQSQPTEAAPAGSAAATDQRLDRFGEYVRETGGLLTPAGIAFGLDGSLCVVESRGHRVSRFDRSGNPLPGFGSFGRGAGQLAWPSGIAIAPDGSAFVADTGNQRVTAFDPAGAAARVWGEFGSNPGQFIDPGGIAADAQRVYVADTGNNRIQVFDHVGRHLLSIGACGWGDGQFVRPVDVAVDSAGHVYVVDADRSRVQKFAPDGRFVLGWGEWGPLGAMLSEPLGLTIHGGRVYVADSRNQRAKAFDLDGRLLFEWGLHALKPREGGGLLHYPADAAVSPDGECAVVCEPFENRIQWFARSTPESESRFNPQQGAGLEQAAAHFGTRIDIAGDLLAISEPDGFQVSLMDLRGPTPILVHRLGMLGSGLGQFLRPGDVEIDLESRRMWVSDLAAHKLAIVGIEPLEGPVRFRPQMARFVETLDLAALGAGLDWLPSGAALEAAAIERDRDGRLYLLDACRRRVVVLAADGAVERSWGGYGDAPGQFRRPTDLAWNAAGNELLVPDAEAGQVWRFSMDGRPRGSIDVRGGSRDNRSEPHGVVSDSDGAIYISDVARDCIHKFDPAGQFQKSWGRTGLKRNEFVRPAGIARHPREGLLVIDHGNHRGQILSTDGNFVRAFGARWFVLPTLEDGD